ncbi:MAG TPA: hypothetical protein VL442_07765 [Mucilaginibacter sp.]|nr:hypothetical protein [Mucilaginibacter sp.]
MLDTSYCGNIEHLIAIMTLKEYKFHQPGNTACFVCDHVMNRNRPILMVIHNIDGDWQFVCGLSDHDNSNIRIISLQQAAEIDPSINDIYEIPAGVGADRESVNGKWELFNANED